MTPTTNTLLLNAMAKLPVETLSFLSSSPIRKYHLGCGTVFLKNWINIGFWQHLEPGRLYANPGESEGTILLNYDLRLGIPAAPNSLEAAYHSHMLEHLTYQEGLTFLQQVFDALKPNGIHRVLVPDLEAFARSYLDPNTQLIDRYRTEVLGKSAEIFQTRASVFMGMLHNHDHKWGYDWDTLNWALTRIGHTNVRRTLFQDSELPDIREIESYSPLRALESLCVECRK